MPLRFRFLLQNEKKKLHIDLHYLQGEWFSQSNYRHYYVGNNSVVKFRSGNKG